MMSKTVLKELSLILGKDGVMTTPEQRVLYGYDATPSQPSVPPDAVLFPTTAEEVAKIVRLANDVPFPVVPRGAGSNLTGGARPIHGGVVLSTQKMNQILEIDTHNLQAVVQPGVVTEQLQDRVEELGFFYPPDPQSREFSTIGGNLAENAGGPRAVKYGVTRQYVLQIQVVLPQGQLVRLGARTLKSVVGYDLLSLIVGSEGTLGVITEATLRLLPAPQARGTLLAAFDPMESAAEAVSSCFQAKILPAAIEFMDSFSIRCVEEYSPVGLPRDAAAVLLMELDGGAEEVCATAHRAEQVLLQAGASVVRLALGEEESEKLWKARTAIGPSLARIAPLKLNEDIVVPLRRLPEAIARIHQIAKEHTTHCACFGHIGDGNIHVNFLAHPDNPDELRRADLCVAETFALAISLGGSITGEHGVGTTKQPFVQLELSGEVLELMTRIKKALDPKDIMNPGKIFPAENPGKS